MTAQRRKVDIRAITAVELAIEILAEARAQIVNARLHGITRNGQTADSVAYNAIIKIDDAIGVLDSLT